MFNFFKKDKTPAPAEKNLQAGNSEQQVVTADVNTQQADEPSISWTERLKKGLSKTRSQLGKQLTGLFSGGKIDEDVYEELETILLTSDVGVTATQALLEDIRNRVKRQSLDDTSQLKAALKEALLDLLAPLEQPLNTNTHKPFIIMLTGVNGAGKTTTIGKLAHLFQAEGKSVLIAAGDTFRAAAREQLQAWGERNNVHVVASEGGDPAAVSFDAVSAGKAKAAQAR